MRWSIVPLLVAGCGFKANPGVAGVDASPADGDASTVDAIVDGAASDGPSPDAAGPARSCAAILASSTAASAVYTIDVDGTGPSAAFDVACDMTTMGGGWTLVGRELVGAGGSAAGPLRFLGADSNNPSALAAGTASGIIGPRFAGSYSEVRIDWGTRYLRFATPQGFEVFGTAVDTTVDIGGFSTSETVLAGWITSGGGARLCVAANAGVRPGDTSWAIKPRNDNRAACGCNDMNWSGRGAFYGGAPDGQQTACTGWGGGWAGVKDDGVQKGGLTTAVETRIWIR